MGNDNRAELVLDGDISPLRRKLREAGDQLKALGHTGERAFGGMGTSLGMLQSKLGALGAVLSVGGLMMFAKRTIDAADNLAKLSQKIGISVEDLSGLQHVANLSGVSLDDLAKGVKQMSRYMADYGDRLKAAGITSTDAKGALIQLADAFSRMKDGPVKTAIAMEVLGKAGADLIPLLNGGGAALRAMIEEGQRLNPMTTEMSKQAEVYNDTMTRLTATLSGTGVVIANDLLPPLTRLAQRMQQALASGLVDGFISRWGAAFKGLAAGLNETLAASEEFLAKITFGKVAENHLKQALAYRNAAKGLYAEMAALTPLPGKAPVATPPPGNGNLASLLGPAKKQTTGAVSDPSHMGTYEAVLAERKNLYEQENVLRQFSKEQELTYWRELQATNEINSKDQLAIAKRTATLELEIRREMGRQGVELTRIEIEGQRAAAIEKIDALEGVAKFEQEQDQITKDQLLAQQQTFLAQRYEIELQAAMQRQELASLNGEDPVEMAKLRQQQLDIERNFQREMGEIQQQRTLESTKDYRNMYASIESGFASVLKNFATGAQTIGQTITGLFRAVSDAVAGMLAELAARWLLQQLLQLVGIKTTTGATIKAKAAEAGAGGTASMAAAPFPLNLTAPAFGATMAAIAASYEKVVVASAVRGYDIPRGLNPVTQLHEEEMVLPQKYANVIRGMVGGQEERGGDIHNHNVNITAMDGADVQRVLTRYYYHVGGAVRRAARAGVQFSK